jgi:hypothetical protein
MSPKAYRTSEKYLSYSGVVIGPTCHMSNKTEAYGRWWKGEKVQEALLKCCTSRSLVLWQNHPELSGKEAGSRGYALMQWWSKNQSNWREMKAKCGGILVAHFGSISGPESPWQQDHDRVTTASQSRVATQAADIILAKNEGNDGCCHGIIVNPDAFNIFLDGPPFSLASSSPVHSRNSLLETDHPGHRLVTDRTLVAAHNHPSDAGFASIMAAWS